MQKQGRNAKDKVAAHQSQASRKITSRRRSALKQIEDGSAIKSGDEWKKLTDTDVAEAYATRDLRTGIALSGGGIRSATISLGLIEALAARGRFYGAAMDQLGNRAKQQIGRHATNRVENSHLPFRRRERAMLRFRQMKSLQKFASVHASLHNHFNSERHLVSREVYKERRSAALAEWQIMAS